MMKSNWIRKGGAEQRQMFREIAKEEIAKQKKEFCPGCQERMAAQAIAVVCKALHDRYGFGKARIAELISCAEGFGQFLHDSGDKYDDAVRWMEEKMDIVLIGQKEEQK